MPDSYLTPPFKRDRQRLLFCRECGGSGPLVTGRCLSCYQRHRHSWQYFAGQRETVLARDGYCCRACGAGKQRAVHHRRPGIHASEWLVTICPACHALIHKLRAHRRWLPVPLLDFWREQHSAVPLQLQLDIERTAAAQGREKGAA